jgi:ferrochelatase
MAPYDAILLISFGGPEGTADVIPFLQNVLRGKNVPVSRMEQVAHHYYQFGGISPINGHCRNLLAALETELKARGVALPIYWGNRNWQPMLEDTIRQMGADGIRHALALVTSAYSSYSSCRQYLEDIERARSTVGDTAPLVDKIPAYYDRPGFVEVNVIRVKNAIETIPAERRAAARLVFTAHSISVSMADNCSYARQLEKISGLVAAGIGKNEWNLVYQSRSGPPTQPWLGPDICDFIKELGKQGVCDLVVSPIGFISDHMEVIYDLDFEAKKVAQALGINLVRTATPGCHPVFISMLGELISDRVGGKPGAQVELSVCPADCCPSGRPPLEPGAAADEGATRPQAR